MKHHSFFKVFLRDGANNGTLVIGMIRRRAHRIRRAWFPANPQGTTNKQFVRVERPNGDVLEGVPDFDRLKVRVAAEITRNYGVAVVSIPVMLTAVTAKAPAGAPAGKAAGKPKDGSGDLVVTIDDDDTPEERIEIVLDVSDVEVGDEDDSGFPVVLGADYSGGIEGGGDAVSSPEASG